MSLIGTGKFTTSKIKLRKLLYLQDSFCKLINPIRFNYTIIDFRDNPLKEPIPLETVREEFDYAKNEFQETTETIIVDEIIWVDNHDNKDWNNLSKVRWMGLMDRQEIILKGEERRTIPDLVEGNVYRPLVMAAADRFDLFRNDLDHIKRKKMRSAELSNFDPFDFFRYLWVDAGDIEAFVVNPVSKQAVRDTIPIKVRYDGHIHHFQKEEDSIS